jgi:glucose/arabinose dehydrogenase
MCQEVTRPSYATGIRNCSGLAVQPGTGTLYCATNERDALGDNLPPDYVTSVTEGAFYGWPWFYIGANEDPRHPNARPDLKSLVTVPDVLLQPHSAPLGLTFNTGNQFPAAWEGDAFVALHGSWNRSLHTGHKIVRLPFRDGKPTGEYQDFIVGFTAGEENVWGRPVDVAFAHDGALLFSEDGNGVIYRVHREVNRTCRHHDNCRQPITVASTISPVCSFHHLPSRQLHANGSV